MDFLQFSLSVCLTFIFLLLAPLVNGGSCSNTNCFTDVAPSSSSYRHQYKYRPIPFPFRSPDQPLSCGLPGFDLTCNSSIPVLTFPSGQSFIVKSISNHKRKIEVGNYSCIQEELARFNSSGTPFYPYYGFTRLKAYTCPSTVEYIGSFFDQCWKVDCVSKGDKSSIFYCDADAEPWSTGSTMHQDACAAGGVLVAGGWLSAYEFSEAGSLYLKWDMPRECAECDSIGQDCGRDPNNLASIKCFPRPSKTRVRVIISSAVILPVLMIISCVTYKCYKKVQSQNQHSTNRLNNTNVSQANLGSTSSSRPVVGIDQATLNTYPIILIGNSGRILTMMEDKICPICLSDYEPNDIVKYLPECLHRFHYDCIDEWLHQKAVCPLCRTIPPLTVS